MHPKSLFTLWRDSIQQRLAVVFTLTSLVLVLCLVGLLLKTQQSFLDDASIRRANSLAKGLASSSSSWVLADDLAGLQEALSGYRDTPNLVRGFILSPDGEVLASTEKEDVGLFVSDEISKKMLMTEPQQLVLVADNRQIDVASPIQVNGQIIGWVRIDMNQQTTKEHLDALIKTSVEFSLFVTLIIIIVALLLARNLVRRLKHLTQLAIKIEHGSRQDRACLIDANDEITQLGRSFNKMLDALASSEQELDRLNQVYAAWTEIVAMIVREKDENALLTELCLILVEKIGLNLAFVAKEMHNKSVEVIACNDNNSHYLHNIKLSVNPDIAEGQGPVGRALREGEPIIINDFQHDSRTNPWKLQARKSNIHSAAAFPLWRYGKVDTCIAVYSSCVDFFTKDVVTLLNGLTNDLSLAFESIDKEAIRKLNEVELMLAATVFDHSQEGIVITDAEQKILRVNNVFSEITGYSADDVIGKTPKILNSGKHDKEFYDRMWEHVAEHQYWTGELINRHKDGRNYPEWLTINQVLDQSGNVTHYVGTFVDITERKTNEERIVKLAFYDPLTELPNRRLLIKQLADVINNQKSVQNYGALLFIDLDRFKVINDTHGHDYGDRMLIEAGQRIKACIRAHDTLARLGGDEFVILLHDLSEHASDASEQVQKIAEKLLKALNESYRFEHHDHAGNRSILSHHSSASIGITLFSGGALKQEDLLKQADMAMYQAKQSGKNMYFIFDPEMQARLNYKTELETDIRTAIQEGQFKLYYQIQVDQMGVPVGAEALLRWKHPKRGMISPAEFIPIAEETTIIIELGSWVLVEAFNTLKKWSAMPSYQDLTLSVNVSAKQLAVSDFSRQVKSLIKSTGITANNLKLEITESTALANLDETILVMRELQEVGVNFSMDDFGTGYSSLAYLQRLPLKQLKIDQSFVRDIQEDSNDAAIVRTILSLGGNLNLEVVAEGVETWMQHQYLLENNCHYFQGYYFGRPLELSEFEAQVFKLSDVMREAA